MDIPFTQYLMPNGRQETVNIDRPEPVARKAQAIIAKGFRFECEMLGDYRTVSLTITDPEEGDVEIEVVPNGPEVLVAIDRMIERFKLPSSEHGDFTGLDAALDELRKPVDEVRE